MAGPLKKKGKSTSATIVHTALKCFMEHGFNETNVTFIAKKAKVPHSLLLYHFPDMNSLLLAVIEIILEELKENTIKAISPYLDNPKQCLVSYVKSYFYWLEKNPEKFSVWLFFYYLCSSNPEFRKINTSIRKLGRERIGLILYQGIIKKDFIQRNHSEIEPICFQIQSLLTGALIQTATEDGADNKSICEETIGKSFEILGLIKKEV